MQYASVAPSAEGPAESLVSLPKRESTPWLDRAGMLTSALCAVHCAASALAMGLLSTLGVAGLAAPAVERVFLTGAVLLGLASILPALRRHRSLGPTLWFAGGMVLLLGLRPLMPKGVAEAAVVMLGALAVIRAHWTNTRLLSLCC